MNWKFWKKEVTEEEYEEMRAKYVDLLNGFSSTPRIWVSDIITEEEFDSISGEDLECAYDQLTARMLYPEEAA
jgi:hypothetical protein